MADSEHTNTVSQTIKPEMATFFDSPSSLTFRATHQESQIKIQNDIIRSQQAMIDDLSDENKVLRGEVRRLSNERQSHAAGLGGRFQKIFERKIITIDQDDILLGEPDSKP